MIAVDTNILVYAHREDSKWHAKAYSTLKEVVESGNDWAVPWPCLHEFLAIVTHPKIYRPPSPLETAIAQVDAWHASPTLRLIGEGALYWDRLKQQLTEGKIQGGMIHDARIAALCVEAGVSVLWSADRDFSRFRRLKIRNPLLDS